MLKDVTFLIPLRLDSLDRLINLQETVDFLLKHFETNIHVLEADSFNSGLVESLLGDKVTFTFVQDNDPVFFRTGYINLMAQQCNTPYISVWDTDVIGVPDQISASVEALRKGEASFSFPYEKNFLDTSLIIRELYLKTRNWQVLERHQNKMNRLYTPNPVGGAFFADRKAYIEAGMENPNFYGWGIEDGERATRWKVLGYEVHRAKGNLYHLTHTRGINSIFQSPRQREIKMQELTRIRNSDPEILKSEIKTWHSELNLNIENK